MTSTLLLSFIERIENLEDTRRSISLGMEDNNG